MNRFQGRFWPTGGPGGPGFGPGINPWAFANDIANKTLAQLAQEFQQEVARAQAQARAAGAAAGTAYPGTPGYSNPTGQTPPGYSNPVGQTPPSYSSPQTAPGSDVQLSVDLVETDDSFNLYADVPGLSKSDLKVWNFSKPCDTFDAHNLAIGAVLYMGFQFKALPCLSPV